ncbi:MAG: hypothetical protein QME47_06805 [Candidatus Thermoplasmatota archaeon]|nr:hypothetical protein [Candidatus Thermoplasmatota archaeon]
MKAEKPSGIMTGFSYTPPETTVQSPPSVPYAPPRREGATSAGIAAIVVIGVVIFFVGAILCNASVITEEKSTYGYGTEYEAKMKEWKVKTENARLIYKIGTIFASVGALVACVGIFTGALGSTKLDLALRIAMLSVGTAIIIVTLVIMLLGGMFVRTTGL